MMNEDSKKRLKAMAEAVAKLMKEQEKQKDQKAAETEDDDRVLAADLMMEASDLLEEAANLVYQATALLNGEDIEADRCFPNCVVEVFCDDEL